jgi:hypothetical protein
MVLSLVIFGFLGGITGVVIGTEQINIIAHNTMRIPGHFHATVVAARRLAFMAVTYYLLPLDLPSQGGVLGGGEVAAVPLLDRDVAPVDGDDLRRKLRRSAPALGHLVLLGAVQLSVLWKVG